jgi:hypothetical protein
MEFRPVAKCGTSEPQAEVVQLLQDALAQARAGNVRSVVVITELEGGRADFGIAWQEARISLLVAELQKANLVLVSKMMAEEEGDADEPEDPPTAS